MRTRWQSMRSSFSGHPSPSCFHRSGSYAGSFFSRSCRVCILSIFPDRGKGLIILPFSLIALYVFYFRARVQSTAVRIAIILPLLAAGLYLSIQWIMASEWGYRLAGVLTGMYDSSARKRGEMAWAGIQIFREHPFFGIGFDQFRLAAWRWGAVFGAYSHSTFIEILSCMGGTGIVLYLAILGRLYVEFHKARRRILGNQELALSAITLWLFLSFVFFSTFSVEYYSKALWPLLGALAGYAGAIRIRPMQSDAEPGPPENREIDGHTPAESLQTSSVRSRWKGWET